VGERAEQLRLRSLVGLIPLLAVEVLEAERWEKFPGFAKRARWFMANRQDLARHISYMEAGSRNGQRRYLLAIPSRERLERMLRCMLDENEFLSPFGIRSLSRIHKDRPYVLNFNGQEHRVQYQPGESDSAMFGGNSNWRGPIWFPVNYLLIEALERYHHFYGDDLKVECPANSGRCMNLREVAEELSSRLMRIFLPGADGVRPGLAQVRQFVNDPHWRDLLWFHECFDGDTGRGVGASHQTGWTALVVRMLEDSRRATTCEEALEARPSWRAEEAGRSRKRPARVQPAGSGRRTAPKRPASKGARTERKGERLALARARRGVRSVRPSAT